MKYLTREAWKNHNGEQVAEPISIVDPQNIADLQEIIQKAESTGRRVKPVGSGHSFSNIIWSNPRG